MKTERERHKDRATKRKRKKKTTETVKLESEQERINLIDRQSKTHPTEKMRQEIMQEKENECTQRGAKMVLNEMSAVQELFPVAWDETTLLYKFQTVIDILDL